MRHPTTQDLRCPQCRAAVREGAPWCTQCYARLLPVEAPVDEPVAARPVPPRVAVQLLPEELRTTTTTATTTSTTGTGGTAGWPCTTCEATNGLDEAACRSCGSSFLSGVRDAEPPLLALPGVGDVVALSRAQRLGLGAVLVLVVVVLTALLSLLTG